MIIPSPSRLTPLQIADLVIDLYEGGKQFDFVEWGAGDDGVCWACRRFPTEDLVVLRGSVTVLDWFRDFVFAVPFRKDAAIGWVHPGFYLGMEQAWDEIGKYLSSDGRRPCTLAGHSLGAARASILGALMSLAKVPPVAIVKFGEPKSGLQELADILRDVPQVSYRNNDGTHHDIVTDVPRPLTHPCALTDVCEPPAAATGDAWGALRYHHMPLYRAALAKLT